MIPRHEDKQVKGQQAANGDNKVDNIYGNTQLKTTLHYQHVNPGKAKTTESRYCPADSW